VDPARQVTRSRAGFALTFAALIIFITACGRSSQVAPPPEPVPTPVVEDPPASTLEEARALKQSDPIKYQRALRALALATDPTTARRAQTLLALDLFEHKQYEQAVPALQTAAASNAVIAPYLQLRAITADEALGRLPSAIVEASSIITNAPSSSAATIAQLQLPALYAAAGDQTNMTASLARVSTLPIDALTEADYVSLATRLAKAGRTDAATDVRMRILRDYPQGRYTEQVYSQLAATTPSPIDALTTDDASKLAQNLARTNRYDQALDLLKRLSTRPDASTSDLYRSVRLRALFNSRNYDQLLSESEVRNLDASLQLLRARAAWREDKSDEFLAGLKHIEKQFPKSREAVEAKVQRAKYYITDEINYKRSIANLSTAIEKGAVGNDGENIWTLGFTYVLAGMDQDALRVFDRYCREYPDGDYKSNALFWTAKIHDRSGRTAERDAALHQVIAEYPYSYYAYRSREILGEPALAGTEVTGAGAFPDLDAELAKISDPRLSAVQELLAVDLTRDATREMKTLAAAYPDNAGLSFMLADVFANGGEVFEAMGILQRRFRPFIRHGGSHIPPRLWQILFPLNYWDSIRAEAQKRNIDPYLVASIIRQESGFEPTTVSNAGAVGLMQIMPTEAARIAADAGIAGITRDQLFDPMTNIAVGAAEYSQKLASMKGNPIFAIAAYNAGEDAVGRWIAQTHSEGDPDIFVDSIPYAETRLYVKSVTRNRFEYRRVYEGSRAVSQAIGRSDSRQ
jgi:peptidoglycan lytic transglycosylase